jgi:hypothetical protein
MNLREIYFIVRPEDIAYVKFIVESYEGVGIIRTVLRQSCPERRRRDQHSEQGRTVDRKEAVIVALVVEDFLAVARSLFASLQNEVAIAEIPRPADIGDDWLMKELATEE